MKTPFSRNQRPVPQPPEPHPSDAMMRELLNPWRAPRRIEDEDAMRAEGNRVLVELARRDAER